jgi:parvulin-like peptidyl-prolyl isomerase
VPQATPAEVRDYYDSHLELFTEPEKLRLSVILLKVDPGAPDEDWKKAWDEALKISDQIKGGADFAEMARKHSRDKTARNGGDMGYLHRGRVPVAIQDGVDKFKVGEVSAPYKGLEGISVFRLEDRIPADRKAFQRSEQRARELLMRDRRDMAWKTYIERLRAAAKIEVVTQPPAVRPSDQPSEQSSGSSN